MENQDALLGIRLTGGDMHPQNLRVREVAELIKYLEDALFFDISEKNSEITKEEIYLSLTSIKDQSASYGTIPSKVTLMVASFLALTTAIQNGDYSNVSIRSIQNIKNIQDFGRKRNCNTEFNLQGESLATIKPNTVIEIPASLYISGYTTIYPYIKRSGGATPTVALRVNPDHPFIYVKTTEDIAKRLGERLYSKVGLTGFATWERRTKRLIEFRIDKILNYRESGISETFSVLKETLGKHWDDVDDIDAYLKDEYEN